MRRRLPLGLVFIGAGVLHFCFPRSYAAIVPGWLPYRRELVYASGVAEIAGGAAALHPRTAPAAGWWLVALLVAVLPANVNMAVHAERWPALPGALLWVRLPLQGLLMAWARWATRPG